MKEVSSFSFLEKGSSLLSHSIVPMYQKMQTVCHCSIYDAEVAIIDVYVLQDAFRSGNEVQLIARATGYPLMMRNGAIFGNGGFVKNDCGFQTTPHPPKRAPRIVLHTGKYTV